MVASETGKSGVNTTTVSLGVVRRGDPIHAQFTIRNSSLERVEVASIAGDCHCSSILISRQNIDAGECAVVEIRVDDTDFIEGWIGTRVQLDVVASSKKQVLLLSVDAYVTEGHGLVFWPRGQYVGSIKRGTSHVIVPQLIVGPILASAEPIILSREALGKPIQVECGEVVRCSRGEGTPLATWTSACKITVSLDAPLGPFDVWESASCQAGGQVLSASLHIAGEVIE
jgi:Protein of unknown function (DUF1573)